ncbi:oligopeptide:H+ symporter [Neisseriaceae bacterium ESL0693]|nr:oligopeptide:H+ symporter [Neisseriaceae bacterium ESL0693]
MSIVQSSPYQGAVTGTKILFFIQTFATMGFAVLYSTLVLYATRKLGFSDAQASVMMGVFGAFNYGLHLFGGYLGGRFLSNRNLFVSGMVLQIIGCCVIASLTVSGLYWGLAMFLTGSGLNVTCLNVMLTQRYAAKDPRRESAFLWNYAGMNLGFFIGFGIAGHFTNQNQYNTLFLLATVGNVVAIAISLCFWRHLADLSTPLLKAGRRQFWQRLLIGWLILLVLIPVVRLMLNNARFSSYFLLVLSILVLCYLIGLTWCQRDQTDRQHMQAYLLLALGSLVFFSLYQLAPSGLMLFMEKKIAMNVWGYQIAPQWVQNINTVCIVFGGPLMAYGFSCLRQRGWAIDIPSQFTTALICMGLGMLVLPLGLALTPAGQLVAFKWIVFSYVLQSLGELLISPVGYAMIGRLAPVRYQGLLMGCWMMVTGVASVLAGFISEQMSDTGTVASDVHYSQTFMLLGGASMGMALILFLLRPFLRKLIRAAD